MVVSLNPSQGMTFFHSEYDILCCRTVPRLGNPSLAHLVPGRAEPNLRL